jgi:predicted dehydrogenase
LVSSGGLAAGVAVSSAIMNAAYAGEDNTIRLALIGCGGRGSGAVSNALEVKSGPVKLHAMADVYENKQKLSHMSLSRKYPDQVDVPEDRMFLGFDAYRKAIDTLKPGDVALCTTHAYCRPRHVEYAISKGVNVFMEKSFAPDPGGLHRMLKNAEEADKKGVKVAAGLMCRHSRNRQQLIAKMRDGQIGDVQLMRAYRFAGAIHLKPRQKDVSEMENQIRRATHFLWASSGRFIEYMIHQIDECCWMADALPVKAQGFGGRIAGSPDCGQNLDSFAVEYTFTPPLSPTCTAPSAPPSSRATCTRATCTCTRTSASRKTTSAGGPTTSRSPPGRPSGTCCWTTSATTTHRTRADGRCSPTSPPSWAAPRFTPVAR